MNDLMKIGAAIRDLGFGPIQLRDGRAVLGKIINGNSTVTVRVNVVDEDYIFTTTVNGLYGDVIVAAPQDAVVKARHIVDAVSAATA